MYTFSCKRPGDAVNPPQEVIVTIGESDVSIGDVVESFKTFLVACGFHSDTVEEYVSGGDGLPDLRAKYPLVDAVATCKEMEERESHLSPTHPVIMASRDE